MKTVNVITSHFPPEITAAAHRLESFVDTLSAEYKVNVFTLTEVGHKSQVKEIQISDNIVVHYLDLPSYPKSVFFIRAFYEFVYSFRLAFKASKTKADITLTTTPFMFLVPAVAIFSRKSKKIIDIRDLTWLYIPANSLFQRLVKRFIIMVMKRFIRSYDQLLVTNPWEESWIQKNIGIGTKKVLIIRNGISTARFRTLAGLHYSSTADSFIVTYIGNLGDGQKLYALIEAIHELPFARLNIIGDGIEMNRLEKYIQERKIRNVKMHGKLKWNRLLPFYANTTILYAGLGTNYSSAIPSKLFEYLTTGLPVLFNGSGEARKLLHDFENIYYVQSESVPRLKSLLEHIHKQHPSRSEENPGKIESKFIREKINKRLLSIVDVMTGRKPDAKQSTKHDWK